MYKADTELHWETSKPLRKRNREESILLALKALDTAAEADTGTGGVENLDLGDRETRQ
jgi:hypothetical protein